MKNLYTFFLYSFAIFGALNFIGFVALAVLIYVAGLSETHANLERKERVERLLKIGPDESPKEAIERERKAGAVVVEK